MAANSSMGSKIAAKLATAKQLIKSSVDRLSDREFETLIRSIGECKSKQEEDRIMVAELEILKQVRAIYCEMLGHDVGFAHVKALQFASEPNILTKKAAYLALTQFFDHTNELVLLLVNTLLSDLKSDNYIAVCTSLVVTTKLIGPELINAVLPLVLERLHHPKEHVRKKAVMVLHRFHQMDPRREGPLAGVDIDRNFRTMLCDKDPAVMSAALSALHEVIKTDPRPYKNLVPSFTSILKQVSENRLPKSYEYHRCPAPFIQIKLLKVLAALGMGDRACSENMYAVIAQTLKRANNSHTIGSAIIYECVRTITTIYPNPQLLASAALSIATFLKSSSHNLRYVGIDALSGIVKINSQYAQEHQLAVIDCLEDPDDTLKLKTLELLYKMTKANNVEVIVERMMTYLRSTTDEHIKKDIVRKVSELAERYAPSPTWFIAVVSEVFELGGSHVEPTLSHNLMRLIAEQDSDLHHSAAEVYIKLLDKAKLPGRLLEVAVWVLGEYGTLAATPQVLMGKLVALVTTTQKASEDVKAYVLVALAKICAQANCQLTPEAEAMVSKCSSSQSVELQQRAHELQAVTSSDRVLQQTVLPPDGSCEDIGEAEMAQIKSLSFLDGYVSQALRAGAAPYLSEEQRGFGAHGHSSAHGGDKGLKFDAYEAAAPPPPVGSVQHRSHSTTGSYDPYGGSGGFGAQSSAQSGTGYGPGHSRTASGGSGTTPVVSGPVPSEFQLKVSAASGGAKRWGPMQYDTPQAVQAAVPSSGITGGAPSQQRQQQQQQPPSERDRLAASIFGGMGSSASSGAGKPHVAASAPPPSTHRTAPAADLLDLSSPAKPSQPSPAPWSQAYDGGAPPPPKQPLDMLMDLGGAYTTTSSIPLSSHVNQAQQKPPTSSTAPMMPALDDLLGDLSVSVTGGGGGTSMLTPQHGAGFGASVGNASVGPTPGLGLGGGMYGGVNMTSGSALMGGLPGGPPPVGVGYGMSPYGGNQQQLNPHFNQQQPQQPIHQFTGSILGGSGGVGGSVRPGATPLMGGTPMGAPLAGQAPGKAPPDDPFKDLI